MYTKVMRDQFEIKDGSIMQRMAVLRSTTMINGVAIGQTHQLATGAAHQARSELSAALSKKSHFLALAFFEFSVAEKISQNAINMAAITGPMTKPLRPKIAMPPSVEISTT
jgi:hypothetical protein